MMLILALPMGAPNVLLLLFATFAPKRRNQNQTRRRNRGLKEAGEE
jgi:hypothetical protein